MVHGFGGNTTLGSIVEMLGTFSPLLLLPFDKLQAGVTAGIQYAHVLQ